MKTLLKDKRPAELKSQIGWWNRRYPKGYWNKKNPFSLLPLLALSGLAEVLYAASIKSSGSSFVFDTCATLIGTYLFIFLVSKDKLWSSPYSTTHSDMQFGWSFGLGLASLIAIIIAIIPSNMNGTHKARERQIAQRYHLQNVHAGFSAPHGYVRWDTETKTCTSDILDKNHQWYIVDGSIKCKDHPITPPVKLIQTPEQLREKTQ